jgi:hypothetical protein
MSSALIRQDLVPMIVGYLLIMGTLAIGLRIVQRSGKAEAGNSAAAGKPAGTGGTARATQEARADHVTAAAAATGAAGVGGGGQPTGPPPGQVTGRARLRALARPGPGWRRLAIFSLGTAVGGYLLLMAVVIGYYFGISPVAGNFVRSAFTGCALLIGLAAPVFITLSWLAERKGWRI